MEEKFESNEWTPPVLCEEHTPSRTAADSAPKQARSGKENVKKTAKKRKQESEVKKTTKKRKQESEGKKEPKRRKAKGIYAQCGYVCMHYHYHSFGISMLN